MKQIAKLVTILGLAAAYGSGQTTTSSPIAPNQDTTTQGSGATGTLAPVVVAKAAAEPFQQELDLTIGAANGATYASITVPSGKRLVIEYLSLFGSLSAGQKLNVSVVTMVSGIRASYRPQLSTQDAGDGTISVSGSQVMRVYADAGTVVSFNALRNSSSGTCPLTVSISGHYITVP